MRTASLPPSGSMPHPIRTLRNANGSVSRCMRHCSPSTKCWSTCARAFVSTHASRICCENTSWPARTLPWHVGSTRSSTRSRRGRHWPVLPLRRKPPPTSIPPVLRLLSAQLLLRRSTEVAADTRPAFRVCNLAPAQPIVHHPCPALEAYHQLEPLRPHPLTRRTATHSSRLHSTLHSISSRAIRHPRIPHTNNHRRVPTIKVSNQDFRKIH
mmetsp:Transcript_33181/g.83389  ORF Transcript_33181/g.83389 Transcript_33181/m.83389 type:complete len:212 (-) Transcript_33181:28-663(-)